MKRNLDSAAIVGLIVGAFLTATSSIAAAQVTGKTEFNEYCAACHGLKGTGDGPLADSLKSKPADLTMLAKNNGGTFPENDVRAYIDGTKTTGAHGTRDMPIWGHAFTASSHAGAGARSEFSPAQVTQRLNLLVDYIKSIQAK